jgi:mycothiol synthase
VLRSLTAKHKTSPRVACNAMNLSNWLECPHLRRISGQVSGLRFRAMDRPSDIETMSEISHLGWKADGVEWMVSPADIRSWLEDKTDHDHHDDVLLVEHDGGVVGFSELAWKSPDEDPFYFGHSVHLLPAWRGKGIMEAMFESNEARLKEITSALNLPGRSHIKLWAFDGPNDWKTLVESSGYEPIWHLLEMTHSSLDSVKDVPEPRGFDFSPVRPDEHERIWALFRECFAHEPWSSPDNWSQDAYEAWIRSPGFSPALWKVARAGSEIVGAVENCVSEEECAAYGRRVARSVKVCVKDGWRRKGLATYLLVSSLKSLRNMGIEEVSLDTEVENKSRAMKVYEGVGFVTRRTFTFYVRTL